MKVTITVLLALSAAVPVTASPPATVGAADAVRLAAGLGHRSHQGRYEMTVVSTGKSAKATFLNSTADYKSPDNLTLSIAPIVANTLTKRYGAPPEVYFKDRTVTVDGILINEVIVNTLSGRAHDFNRVQHTIRIERAAQIVAVR